MLAPAGDSHRGMQFTWGSLAPLPSPSLRRCGVGRGSSAMLKEGRGQTQFFLPGWRPVAGPILLRSRTHRVERPPCRSSLEQASSLHPLSLCRPLAPGGLQPSPSIWFPLALSCLAWLPRQTLLTLWPCCAHPRSWQRSHACHTPPSQSSLCFLELTSACPAEATTLHRTPRPGHPTS